MALGETLNKRMGKPVLCTRDFLTFPDERPHETHELYHFEAHCSKIWYSTELHPQVGKARQVRLMPWGSTKWVLTPRCSTCTHSSSSGTKGGHLGCWDKPPRLRHGPQGSSLWGNHPWNGADTFSTWPGLSECCCQRTKSPSAAPAVMPAT